MRAWWTVVHLVMASAALTGATRGRNERGRSRGRGRHRPLRGRPPSIPGGTCRSRRRAESGAAARSYDLPRPGMSPGVHLLVDTGKERLSVHVGPEWYIERQDVPLEPGDAIEVKGSRITFEGKPALVAAEVRKGADVLRLRDEDGFPAWSGWRAARGPSPARPCAAGRRSSRRLPSRGVACARLRARAVSRERSCSSRATSRGCPGHGNSRREEGRTCGAEPWLRTSGGARTLTLSAGRPGRPP
jgi:hypothetical protein